MSERTQKLLRLAQALEALHERLLADAADATTAAALGEQLSGTLAELSLLRRLVGDSPASEATRRLYLALEALELAARTLPATPIISLSRPAVRRARRLDQTAQRLIARAAAVALLIEAASPWPPPPPSEPISTSPTRPRPHPPAASSPSPAP